MLNSMAYFEVVFTSFLCVFFGVISNLFYGQININLAKEKRKSYFRQTL
ncbi:hypothetical protein V202x_28350 [Gimesia aquarii]|uniref:Uncharacterized protein n=1 Tax=Gimesia aquarii TaxID=2527964 RepID=A0A517WW21_9PLAN|nr:hypothetical protein V202x_28350 [Gimesia aquarii]